MAYLAPSILSADFSKLEQQIALIEAGGADYVHMDVMDGAFVPNITFGGPVVQSLAGKTKLPFDVHLMIEHPEQRLADFVTPQTEFITVHAEACNHLDRVVQQIHSLGKKAGVALNPATSLVSVDCLIEELDMVLVMSVNPGFGGQKFIPYTLEKIKELDELRKIRNPELLIEIDGGVDLKNCREIADAGTDILVAGSAVFKAEDVVQRVKDFKSIL